MLHFLPYFPEELPIAFQQLMIWWEITKGYINYISLFCSNGSYSQKSYINVFEYFQIHLNKKRKLQELEPEEIQESNLVSTKKIRLGGVKESTVARDLFPQERTFIQKNISPKHYFIFKD